MGRGYIITISDDFISDVLEFYIKYKKQSHPETILSVKMILFVPRV